MPRFESDSVAIEYEDVGAGEPVLLVAGCGQPAGAWHMGIAPRLVGAGYRVVTFDNRGMAPSSAPPPPYSVDEMADDALALLDHLGIERVRLAGHSMGGWIAETLAYRRPERVVQAVLMGSCNEATAWEMAITTVEVELARRELDLPPLFFATETLRYLSNSELQDDATVEAWLSMIAELEVWPNPGRLGQYQACLAWSSDLDRVERWPDIAVPVLVVAFEHDVDSPPAHARRAAARIPGSEFVEIPAASHLGIFTHADAVADELLAFFAATGPT